jgi:putative ABC transport system ATP-binding protein
MNNYPVVALRHVTKIYGVNSHVTLGVDQATLSAYKGEVVLILGPSGSGKTTLLTLIAGLVSPTSGTICLFNKDIRSYNENALQKLRALKIGFIFQTFRLIETLNVQENIELVLHFAGEKTGLIRQKSEQILKRFNISHLARQRPGRLSQGEKQRVAICRAVINDAPLIIADEPTANLDGENGKEIIKLLYNYARVDNKCIIVTSHDLRLIKYATRVVYLQNGKISREEKKNFPL